MPPTTTSTMRPAATPHQHPQPNTHTEPRYGMPGGTRDGKDVAVLAVHPDDVRRLRSVEPLSLATPPQVDTYRALIRGDCTNAYVIHHPNGGLMQISHPVRLVKYRSSLSGNPQHARLLDRGEDIRLSVGQFAQVAGRGSSGSPILNPSDFSVLGIVFGERGGPTQDLNGDGSRGQAKAGLAVGPKSRSEWKQT